MAHALTSLAVTGASFGAENNGSYYGPISCEQFWNGALPFVFIFLPIFLLALRYFDKKLRRRRR